MNRIATLSLLVSIFGLTTTIRADDTVGILTLDVDDTLAERLEIERPGETWIAVDGGMIRPLRSLAGFDPGLHDLLLLERSESGGVRNERWVTIDVVDPAASGRDAFPLTYLVDHRPPTLDPLEPAFIRPEDALPVSAYDESGIRRVVYMRDGREIDIASPSEPWPVGSHTVAVEGEDRAGNRTSLKLSFEVDATPPEITITAGKRVTDNGVALAVRGRGELEVTADDDRSGVASLLFRMGQDRWRGVRGPVEVDEDAGSIEFLATDHAGNQQIVRREVRR